MCETGPASVFLAFSLWTTGRRSDTLMPRLPARSKTDFQPGLHRLSMSSAAFWAPSKTNRGVHIRNRLKLEGRGAAFIKPPSVVS